MLTVNDFKSNFPLPTFSAKYVINDVEIEVYKYTDSNEATVWIKTDKTAKIYGAPKTTIDKALLKANLLITNLTNNQK